MSSWWALLAFCINSTFCAWDPWELYFNINRRERNSGGRVIFELVDLHGTATTNGSGILIAQFADNPESLGTVCDDGWDNRVADVVCKELGYTCHESYNSGTASPVIGRMFQKVVIDDVQCSDSSIGFDTCIYNTAHNCEHTEDVTLHCAHLCDYKFELVDDNGVPAQGNSGLLIASKVGTDKKGTVCDDMFNVNAATLICKSMGYKCASNWDVKKELEIQQNFKIILDNVMCTRPSGEFSEACSFSTSHNCGHDEDIFLNCGCIHDKYDFHLMSSNGSISLDGTGLLIVEERETPDNIGTVCNDNFKGSTARVICIYLGFSCSVWWESGAQQNESWTTLQSQLPIDLVNVVCGDNETELAGCSFATGTEDCQHSEDVFLFCGSESSCTDSKLSFYLVDENNEKTETGRGLLIASIDSFRGAKGTVCDDNFSSKSGSIICAEMGYKCSLGWKFGFFWEAVQTEYDVMLDDMACGDGNSSLADCTWETQHNCNHLEDVFISCADDCTYTFSLLNEDGTASDTGAGLLIASRANGENGTVCDDNFVDSSADVICKELGFSCSIFWKPQEFEVASDIDIMLKSVVCLNSDETFANCSFLDDGHNCRHREDIYLICADTCQETESVSFRLVNGSNEDASNEGRGLLIASRHMDGNVIVEGTVCDDEFSMIEADVLCKGMGFSCSHFFSTNAPYADLQASYNIVLDNVQCMAGEGTTFKDNCTYDTSHNCAHSEDIILACGYECSDELAKHVEFNLVSKDGNISTSNEGLLLATTLKTTGTVCDDQFSGIAADAICIEMGYKCFLHWKADELESWEHLGYPIALDDVICNSTNWTDCGFSLGNNCGHSEDVILACSYSCMVGSDFYAKLVDNAGDFSRTGEGLLIVVSMYTDLWGTVCSTGFTLEDGGVFCKSLGYSCATKVSSAEMEGTEPWLIQNTYKILMSDVHCTDLASKNIKSCEKNPVHDCSHQQDVYLSCGGKQNIARVGVASQSDVFEKRFAWKAIDGNTDGNYFARDESSVTHTTSSGTSAWWKLTWDRQMSIDTVRIYNRADCCQEWLEGASLFIDRTLVGNVPRTASDNVYTFYEIKKTSDVLEIRGALNAAGEHALVLAEVEVFGEPTSNSKESCKLTFKMLNEDGTASTSGSGLLVVNKQGYSDIVSGTVCDDYFSQQSAHVICRSMGFQCAFSWFADEKWTIQSKHQIILDDVTCPSSDEPFSNCTYKMTDNNCDHSEDVFLSCDTGYTDLGCWLDTVDTAIPTMNVSRDLYGHSADFEDVCKSAAIARGWSVFGVQVDGTCSGSSDAEQQYQRFGSASCEDVLAQKVYKIADSGAPEYLGCWKQASQRPIPSLEFEPQQPLLDGMPYFRDNPINKCRVAALSKGFSVFAVQPDGRCLSSPDAQDTYKIRGPSTDCRNDGQGGPWSTQVYQITNDSCSADAPGYKFYLVDEKGNIAKKFGLLIAEAKAGSGQKVPGTVCDDGFNNTAATVVCKEMGYACSPGWTRKQWVEIQSTYHIVLDDIECGHANLTFDQCNYKRMATNCGHNEDVFLKCDNECTPVKFIFTLVDKESGDDVTVGGTGLLMAAENGTANRGTVCDDMFSIVTGTIVCTEMGFKCAREYYKVMPISDIQSTYDIILDNVECSENATVFGDCSYDIGHNCGHAEDVFLTCKHTEAECEQKDTFSFYLAAGEDLQRTDSRTGLLIAEKVEEGTIGTVCDDKFNNSAADIVCKEMGYNCATSWFLGASEAQANWTIILDNIECGEGAETFSDCSYNSFHDCMHNEDVYLICQNVCKGRPFSFFLIDNDGHQTTKGEGLLIGHTLKSDDSISGGTVCGDEFNDEAANVICKQMGHDQSLNWHIKHNAQGIQLIYSPLMNNVSCTSSDLDFSTCSYTFDHTCQSDIYLRCQKDSGNIHLCPPGAQLTNEATCEPCPQNTYKPSYVDDECVPCEAGQVSAEGSTECLVCPPDSPAHQDGVSCECEAGTFWDTNTCTPCPAGKYSDSPGAISCAPCPVFEISTPGAISCNACSEGQFWNNGKCETCPEGSYGDRIKCTSENDSNSAAKILADRKNSRSWLWPVICLVLMCAVCLSLLVAVVRYKNKVVALTRIPYGMDMVDGDDEFVVMSYEPRMVESSADNVQLLPVSD